MTGHPLCRRLGWQRVFEDVYAGTGSRGRSKSFVARS
jgi:hypothetical protein